MIRGHQITKSYGPNLVLDRLSFDTEDGEFVCVVGPSGCGKTTLLRIAAGLLEPDAGSVTLERSTNPVHHSSFVFQRPALLPWRTVLDNVGFGVADRSLSRAERRDLARPVLETVGLAPAALHHPHQLSGGMQQRANLARALVGDPSVLFMDEPFSSLDAQTRHLLREELLRIWEDDHKDVLFVTHDIEEAILLADRVIVMGGQPGQIREEIPVPLSRPRDLTGRGHPELAELRWHIWSLIADQVRSASNQDV